MAAIKANGAGWTVVVLQSVGIACLVGVLGWVSSEAVANRDFRIIGGRFTQEDASEFDRRLGLVELELENRPPKWLTDDLDDLKEQNKDLQKHILRLEDVVFKLTADK